METRNQSTTIKNPWTIAEETLGDGAIQLNRLAQNNTLPEKDRKKFSDDVAKIQSLTLAGAQQQGEYLKTVKKTDALHSSILKDRAEVNAQSEVTKQTYLQQAASLLSFLIQQFKKSQKTSMLAKMSKFNYEKMSENVSNPDSYEYIVAATILQLYNYEGYQGMQLSEKEQIFIGRLKEAPIFQRRDAMSDPDSGKHVSIDIFRIK